MSGAYAEVGARLVERGYAAIPIMPGTKRPGELRRGEWVGKTNWREEYTRRLPSRFEIQIWSNSDAGACVVCGPASQNLIGFDIDTDEPKIRDALLRVLPPTSVIKRGQKGETRFYLGTDIEPLEKGGTLSPSWNIDGKRICDIIGPGRQTVLPPTIHPDTKQPYQWIGADALQDVDPSDLTELPPDIFKQICAALAPLGWREEPAYKALPTGGNFGDGEKTEHRKLNESALANLDAWVPSLGLYRCKRYPQGYEAVATWRASTTGRPIDQRKLNLKVSRQGITDFGDGPRGYTPLNLWMAASDCDLDTAFRGLSDRLGWNDSPIILLQPKAEPEQAKPCELVEVIRDEEGTDELPDPVDAFDELTRCKGLIGEIVDWITATARRPNRALALGAAITVIGTLVGRRVAGPTRSATHLYVVGLASTASGKQHPAECVLRLMRAAKAGHHIGPSEWISMPAVINMLCRQPLALCAQDEFGAFLKRINGRRASGFEAGISKILRMLWGTSFSEYMTPEWAGRSAASISCPAISIYGTTAPAEFFEALQGSDLSNGFLNRFLVISATRARSVVPELEPGTVPEGIANALSDLYRWGGDEQGTTAARLNHDTLNPTPIVLPWASVAASQCFTDFEHHIDSLIETDEEIKHFIGRTAEIAVRLATIRAVGRWGPYGDGPTIDLSDIEWGIALAQTCGMALAKEAKSHMAETDRQAWSNRIVQVIKNKGTATPRTIQQYVRNAIKGADIKDILESLCEAGMIEKVAGDKGGRLVTAGYRYMGE